LNHDERTNHEKASGKRKWVFKTTGTITYSSVFFTLDCGYWSADAEAHYAREWTTLSNEKTILSLNCKNQSI